MLLHVRRLSKEGTAPPLVCVHGVGQHGGIFADLGERLERAGTTRSVLALDLRGHGGSGHVPPWDMPTQLDDLLETVDSLGIERAVWVGHSYGAVVAAALAEQVPERTAGVALFDPPFEVPPTYGLTCADIDRRDWSFATVESAVNALMSAKTTVDVPRETLVAFAAGDLRRGLDGRFRFSHNPSATVVIWNEVVKPAPTIMSVPTLLVRPAASHIDGRAHDERYREALGPLLTFITVPKGHNLLWEAPAEVADVVARFLTSLES